MNKATNFNELPKEYWQFVCDYLPNFYKREDVQMSQALISYFHDEESVSLEDYEWLPDTKEAALAMMSELDLKLYNEAVDAYNEKMKSHHFRLHLLREEILSKIWDVLHNQRIDVTRYGLSVSVRHHHTGETYVLTLSVVKENGFYTKELPEEMFRYTEMDIADLCAVLDLFTIGEWKPLVNHNSKIKRIKELTPKS